MTGKRVLVILGACMLSILYLQKSHPDFSLNFLQNPELEGEEDELYYAGDSDNALFVAEVEEYSEESAVPSDRAECQLSSRRKDHIGFVNGPRMQIVHIPATGGTSLQYSFNKWVAANDGKMVSSTSNLNSVQSSSFLCPEQSLEASILMGRRGYGYCDQVENSKRGLFTFAVLRRPVTRMISVFESNLRSKNARATHLFHNKNLNELVKRYNSTKEVEEGEFLLRFSGSQQSRFMCGYECMGPNARKNATINLDFIMRRAKDHLVKTDIVGITEELDSVIPQLKFHLTFVGSTFAHWMRTTGYPKPTVDSEALEILSSWALADLELYRLAKELATKKTEYAKGCLLSSKGG